MKYILRIFILGLCVGFPLLNTAHGASLEEPVRLERGIRHALDQFNERYEGQTKELAVEHLRLFVLQHWLSQADFIPEVFDGQRSLLIDQNISPLFIEHYDAAVNWVNTLTSGDGNQAFKLSKMYGNHTGEKIFNRIRSRLRLIAERKEYPAALFEEVGRRFESSKKVHWQMGCSILQRLAKSGEVEAALELGRRYKKGDKLILNNKLALYWLTKAQLIYIENDSKLHLQYKKLKKSLEPVPTRGERKKEFEMWLKALSPKVSPDLYIWQMEVLQRISAEDLRDAEILVRARNFEPTCRTN